MKLSFKDLNPNFCSPPLSPTQQKLCICGMSQTKLVLHCAITTNSIPLPPIPPSCHHQTPSPLLHHCHHHLPSPPTPSHNYNPLPFSHFLCPSPISTLLLPIFPLLLPLHLQLFSILENFVNFLILDFQCN